MTLWQSVALGLIQGLTEFLPISSTAHLRIVPALFGWPDPGAAFTAVIQLGTLLALMLYFSHDIIAITRATLVGANFIHDRSRLHPAPTANEARIGWMIAVGTVPVVFLGLLFKNRIEHNWRSLYVIAAAMIALAVVLAVAEW